MPRDLSLVGTRLRPAGRAEARQARAIPRGYGLLAGAALSAALWIGVAKLVIGIFF